MDEDMNFQGRTIRLDTIRALLGEALVGRLRDRNDDGAIFFLRELEQRLTREYETERAEHQFANGSLIPLRRTVAPLDGQRGVYFRWTHTGQAKWVASGAKADIPRVALKRFRETYEVHRMALGWDIDLDDIARAELNGVPIEMQAVRAVFEGLDQMLDDVLFEGDTGKGLHGLTNLPGISVLEAPAGAAGAHRWTTTGGAAKTFEEIFEDIEALFQTMRAVTRDLHEPTHVFMSSNYWSRTAAVFRGTTSYSVREHLQKTWPNVTWRSVRRLGTAGQYSGPVIMGIKLTTEEDLWGEVPGDKMLGEIKREDESMTGYNKTYAGGVVTPYPYRLCRMDFPADA